MRLFRTFSSVMSVCLLGCLFLSVSATAKTPRLPLKQQTTKSVAGFQVAQKNCKIYPTPSQHAKAVLKLRKGRKLWLEPFDMHWSMGFDRRGKSVFIPVSCFRSTS